MTYFSKYVFWHISLSCPISVSEKANLSFWALICFAVFFKHHARLPRLLASCVWLYLQNEAALLFSPLSSSIYADTSSAQAGYLPPPHKSRLYFTSSLAGLINKKIYPRVCLPSCAPLPLTAAISVRTFLLRFKAPRRLMSYPPIMKGETLLGFETAAERASSSLLSPPLPLPFVFISRSESIPTFSPGWNQVCDWTSSVPSFFFNHMQKDSRLLLSGPIKEARRRRSAAALLRCFPDEEQRRLLLLHQLIVESLLRLRLGTAH